MALRGRKIQYQSAFQVSRAVWSRSHDLQESSGPQGLHLHPYLGQIGCLAEIDLKIVQLWLEALELQTALAVVDKFPSAIAKAGLRGRAVHPAYAALGHSPLARENGKNALAIKAPIALRRRPLHVQDVHDGGKEVRRHNRLPRDFVRFDLVWPADYAFEYIWDRQSRREARRV